MKMMEKITEATASFNKIAVSDTLCGKINYLALRKGIIEITYSS